MRVDFCGGDENCRRHPHAIQQELHTATTVKQSNNREHVREEMKRKSK